VIDDFRHELYANPPRLSALVTVALIWSFGFMAGVLFVGVVLLLGRVS
jgi:hypothetical protein